MSRYRTVILSEEKIGILDSALNLELSNTERAFGASTLSLSLY